METKSKKFMAAGALLILIGLVIFCVVMTGKKWKFSEVETGRFVTYECEIREDFDRISVKSGTADLRFEVSPDDICRIVISEYEEERHHITRANGKLSIEKKDERKWYEYIFNITLNTPKITVRLPKKDYVELFIDEDTGKVYISDELMFDDINITASTGDIDCQASAYRDMKITTSTGDVTLKSVGAKNFTLETDTGRITLTDTVCRGDLSIKVDTGKTIMDNVICKNFTTTGSTGDLNCNDLLAEGTVKIKRSTGDVKLDDSDAEELYIETSTGRVSGHLRTSKIFFASSDTGKITIPKNITGGRCEITTDTGNIHFD